MLDVHVGVHIITMFLSSAETGGMRPWALGLGGRQPAVAHSRGALTQPFSGARAPYLPTRMSVRHVSSDNRRSRRQGTLRNRKNRSRKLLPVPVQYFKSIYVRI